LNPHAANPCAVDFTGNSHSLISIGGAAKIEEELIEFAQFPAGKKEITCILCLFAGPFSYPQNEDDVEKDDSYIDDVQTPDMHQFAALIPSFYFVFALKSIKSEENWSTLHNGLRVDRNRRSTAYLG